MTSLPDNPESELVTYLIIENQNHRNNLDDDQHHSTTSLHRHYTTTAHPTMSSFQLPAGLRPSAQPQGGNDEERAAKAAQQAQREEMKRTMIQAMLEVEARERREYR